jgi:hypothetical protein
LLEEGEPLGVDVQAAHADSKIEITLNWAVDNADLEGRIEK